MHVQKFIEIFPGEGKGARQKMNAIDESFPAGMSILHRKVAEIDDSVFRGRQFDFGIANNLRRDDVLFKKFAKIVQSFEKFGADFFHDEKLKYYFSFSRRRGNTTRLVERFSQKTSSDKMGDFCNRWNGEGLNK